MNVPCKAVIADGRNAIPSLRQRKARMAEMIHVLFVGPVDRCYTVHDALVEVPNSQLSLAKGYRELWVLPQQEAIHVAILHEALPSFEFEAASRLIRRRWPRARILLLRSKTHALDDALYDDRLADTERPEILRVKLRQLAAGRGSLSM